MKKWLLISLLLLLSCSDDDETVVPPKGGGDIEAQILGEWHLDRVQVVQIDNKPIANPEVCDSIRTSPQAWIEYQAKKFTFEISRRASIEDFCGAESVMSFSTFAIFHNEENHTYTVQTAHGDYFDVVDAVSGPGVELVVTYSKYYKTVNLFYVKDW